MPAEFGPSTQFEVLEEKINSLRRQVLTIAVTGVLLVAALVAFVANGRSSPGQGAGTVEAQSFVVRDPQGRVRAVLQSMEDAGPQLVFFRDPLPAATWRAQSMSGPFAFGLRDWRGQVQMLLATRSGPRLDFSPSSLSLSDGKVLFAVSKGGDGLQVDLADSTGARTQITATTMAKLGADGRRR